MADSINDNNSKPQPAQAKAKPTNGRTKAPTKSKLIIVRSLLPSDSDGGDRVVLSEQDARHPNGQAFVAGKSPVQVFPTPAVSALLREGKLKDITNGDDDPEVTEEEEPEE